MQKVFVAKSYCNFTTMKGSYLLCLTLFLYNFLNALPAFSQNSEELIRNGNKNYKEKKYSEAEIDYRKALENKNVPFVGNYNLGNTFYQQGKFEEAKQQYELALANKKISKEELAKVYHNMGNALLKDKKYEESIEAYKQSLKLNPNDNDTRYNLAYAQAMLRQQQQQQSDDKKNDKDKQDKNNKDQKQDKQQEKKDQQKEEQQKQDQQQQDQANQKEDQKKEQAKKDKISKEDAEKILQALNNDEKKTQKKLNIKEATKVQIEKEW